MLIKIIEHPIQTDISIFREIIFFDGKNTAICLALGNIESTDSLLLRIHSHCISSHVFLYNGCNCREQMKASQERISNAGSGLIIWLDQEGRSNGHAAKVAAEKWKENGMSQDEAYIAAGFNPDAREYSLALKIINYFRPRSIHLLTSNKYKEDAVKSIGIPVTTEGV